MTMLTTSNTSIFRSLDGGATFARRNWSVTSLVPWWGADDYNTRLNAASSLAGLAADEGMQLARLDLKNAKRLGFSDRQIALARGVHEDDIRAERKAPDL